jgi:hypothetical protein
VLEIVQILQCARAEREEEQQKKDGDRMPQVKQL